jgi:hypothetical protein
MARVEWNMMFCPNDAILFGEHVNNIKENTGSMIVTDRKIVLKISKKKLSNV